MISTTQAGNPKVSPIVVREAKEKFEQFLTLISTLDGHGTITVEVKPTGVFIKVETGSKLA